MTERLNIEEKAKGLLFNVGSKLDQLEKTRVAIEGDTPLLENNIAKLAFIRSILGSVLRGDGIMVVLDKDEHQDERVISFRPDRIIEELIIEHRTITHLP